MESSHRALLARTELLRIEAEEDVSRMLRCAFVAVCGALGLLAAWLALMALSVLALDAWIPVEGSLALVAGVNATIGGALVVAGARMLRRLRLMRPDE